MRYKGFFDTASGLLRVLIVSALAYAGLILAPVRGQAGARQAPSQCLLSTHLTLATVAGVAVAYG